MSCSICMNEVNCDIVNTPCGHVFCNKCLTKWLMKKNTCPMCRHSIGEWDEDEDEDDEEEVDDIDIYEDFENVRMGDRSIIDDYVEDFEDAMWDLIDNIDNESYLTSKKVQIVDGVYITKMEYHENNKIVSAIISYDSSEEACKMFYGLEYKMYRNVKRKSEKIHKRINKVNRIVKSVRY
jgi:hypothetical protein